MTAPFLLIVFPIILAIGLFLLRNRQSTSKIVATIFCFLVGISVIYLPIDRGLPIGKISINFASTWIVLGRKFVIEKSDLNFISMLFILGGVWFLGTLFLKGLRLFSPVGVGILGLLVATISVDPFIYSALIIEVIVLLVVLLMTERGKPIGKGVLRYLIFQSLALPFILFTGWVLNVAGVNPSNQATLIQAILFLGLGFVFWLGVFPFYSWVPLVAETVHPYVTGFVFSMVPTVILLLIIDFLNGFAWLRESTIFYSVLLTLGTIMITTGGIWAAFQNQIRRLLGYGVIIEIGLSLIAIGLHQSAGLEYLIMAMVPRIIAILLWVLALSLGCDNADGNKEDFVQGFVHKMPFSAGALMIAMFTMAGFPGFGNFGLRLGLLNSLLALKSAMPFWVLIGLIGYGVGCVRECIIIIGPGGSGRMNENRLTVVFLIAGSIALILIGLLPKYSFKTSQPF